MKRKRKAKKGKKLSKLKEQAASQQALAKIASRVVVDYYRDWSKE